MRLAKGDIVYVPFHPRKLRYLIDASVKLGKKAHEQVKEDIGAVHGATKNLEDFLLVIEAISILLSLGAASIEGASLGWKAASAKLPGYSNHIAKETLETLAIEMGKTSAEILGMAVEASHAPKKGFFFYLRHSPIGWLSPGYWSSLYVSIKTKEPEVFLYGAEGIVHKRVEMLVRQTYSHVQNLEARIGFMRNQLESPIYTYK